MINYESIKNLFHTFVIIYETVLVILIIYFTLLIQYTPRVTSLGYEPEGRGFDSRRGHWGFSLT
jgi:hypothetical protein